MHADPVVCMETFVPVVWKSACPWLVKMITSKIKRDDGKSIFTLARDPGCLVIKPASMKDFCGSGTPPRMKRGNLEELDLPLHDSSPRGRLRGSLEQQVTDTQGRECYRQCRNGWHQQTGHRWGLICPPGVFHWIKGLQGRDLEGKQSQLGNPTPWVTCSQAFDLSLKDGLQAAGQPQLGKHSFPFCFVRLLSTAL